MPEFVRYPDPVLEQIAGFCPVDANLLAIGRDLLAAQMDARSYGLAAAHIGICAPVIIINLASEAAARNDVLLFNPSIAAVSETTGLGNEGSVSMPGIEVRIARPVWVILDYQDADGRDQQKRLEGFAARCALHETDQVNGVFFLKRLSRLKREAAIKRFRKSQSAG
ncbi:peptide deformylase [Devosia rhodophyticola]|uniref:Peptide deformylase-like n=1 Tax=Devosia rhodophyticola TaxID=3026423 RepID=A0ABY7YXC4_9HYPH|nr:peptide deformylase [Devosia rhodophyticola]WDR05665.1 peptide deformylase [Devosia rhodophyticola]